MIEMLGVLAIIGVLSAGGVWGYNLAMEEYKVNKFATDMSTIAANTINVFGSAKNMGENIRGPALCQAKIVPQEYCKNLNPTTGRLKGLWGGESMDMILTQTDRAFYVWDWLEPNKGGISRKACVKLATMKWTGFKKVRLGIYHNASTRGSFALPISTSLAKQWCYDTKGVGSQMGMEFYF